MFSKDRHVSVWVQFCSCFFHKSIEGWNFFPRQVLNITPIGFIVLLFGLIWMERNSFHDTGRNCCFVCCPLYDGISKKLGSGCSGLFGRASFSLLILRFRSVHQWNDVFIGFRIWILSYHLDNSFRNSPFKTLKLCFFSSAPFFLFSLDVPLL